MPAVFTTRHAELPEHGVLHGSSPSRADLKPRYNVPRALVNREQRSLDRQISILAKSLNVTERKAVVQPRLKNEDPKPPQVNVTEGEAAVQPLLINEDPNPAVKVTERGVQLRFFLKLVEQGDVDGEWTIQEVVERFVRPKTAVTKGCLFDVIPETYTGLPRFFVSHTWSRRLKDLLALLLSRFVEKEDHDTLLWLDIVAINQHPYEDKGCLLQDDVASLASVVQATEQTLFCLDEQCVVLTRIWCLYEVWQTFLAKGVSGLIVLMPTVDVEELTEVLETFDVMQAQARQAEDKERILQQITDSMGSTEVNLQLKAALVNSAKYEAKHTNKTGAELSVILDKGASLCMAMGQYTEAEPMYLQVLEESKRVWGADHPETLISVRHLAYCISKLNRCPEAEAMYQQALEGSMRVLGADHPSTLCSVGSLALCMYTQGRYQEAEPLYQQALEGMKRVLGADHRNTLTGVDNLANCMNCLRRYEEAEPLYQQALEGRKRVLGADHPDTISSVFGLAIFTNLQGRNQEAEALFQQVVEGNKRVLGADHPQTLDSVSNLAVCINAQGRFQEAEALYRQALEGRERVLYADHPDITSSMDTLAGCIAKQGRYKEAEALYQQAIEVRRRVLGADHPDTISYVNYLGNYFYNQGRYQEAEITYQQVLEGIKRLMGADDPEISRYANKLAICIEKQGRYKEAEAMYQQSLEGMKGLLGADHPDTGDTMYSLAECIEKQGQRSGEAQALFMSLAETYSRVYGPEHDKTTDALSRAGAD
eukprot:gene26687-4263_t